MKILEVLCAGGGLFAFIMFLINRHDAKKDSPERKMLRAMGSRELSILLKDWKHSDIRLAEDWEDIEDLYEGYKALNGNGRIKKLYEECKRIDSTD